MLLLPQRYEFSSKSQLNFLGTNRYAGCCCYRKGTNFQANHNCQRKLPNSRRVVVATAKVRIFKQITTARSLASPVGGLLLLPQRYEFSSKSQRLTGGIISFIGCCCYRKGTNFQANHNISTLRQQRCSVVVATAKVRIFKQITTKFWVFCYVSQLLLLPQRYEFSSKSQQFLNPVAIVPVVVATAKVRIFKQITTSICSSVNIEKLLLLPQRYEFSSKSQLTLSDVLSIFCCCCYRKGTNFQANHNYKPLLCFNLIVVVATAKVRIFKQITTLLHL